MQVLAGWGHSSKGWYYGLKMTMTRDFEGRNAGASICLPFCEWQGYIPKHQQQSEGHSGCWCWIHIKKTRTRHAHWTSENGTRPPLQIYEKISCPLAVGGIQGKIQDWVWFPLSQALLWPDYFFASIGEWIFGKLSAFTTFVRTCIVGAMRRVIIRDF